MAVSIGSTLLGKLIGMEKACLESLVLRERRERFPQACFAPSIVDTRLRREVVFPRLAPRFRIEAVS
jgi:hypothetical protein